MALLSNQVALITGGTSGIGQATAQRFLAEGAKVAVTGSRPETVDAYKAQAEAQGQADRTFALVSDAASPRAGGPLFQQVVDRFGKIDIVFFNAGVVGFATIDQATEAEWDRLFNINLKGPYFQTQAVLPHLNAGARLLYNTSVVNVKGFPGASTYSATKAGLRSVVRVLASELSPRGYRVNAVSPGPIDTPIHAKLGKPAAELEQMTADFARNVPLARLGASAEVAEAALFLVNPASSYVNGVELAVDGGMTQV